MEKLTTQKLKKAIAKDEKRLSYLKVGSKEWCNLFATIEYTKDLMEERKI